MPIANIERFKPTLSTDTTSSIIFKQAYHELFSSMLTPPAGMLNYEGLDSSLNNLEYANIIPIGLMHYNYHALDSNAFTNGQIDTLPNGQLIDAPSQTQSPYVQQQFFMAAPLLGSDFVVEEDEPIVFYFDDRFFLQNTGITITEIRIDFGDGEPEWIVQNPFGNSASQRSVLGNFLRKAGRTLVGRILVIGVNALNQTIQFGSPFKLFAKKKPNLSFIPTDCMGEGQKWVINNTQPAQNHVLQINSQYNNNGLDYTKKIKVKANGIWGDMGFMRKVTIELKDTAFFFYQPGSSKCTNRRVTKPIVFIDGFDPDNSRGMVQIFRDFINQPVTRQVNGLQVEAKFGQYMLNQGYDLIILDFKHGNDLLERNAMTLVSFLQRLNDTYGANYEQNITLIGPSMGSLIAQYALAYMEKNNIQHRVKTYISFDGCHQGANVPIGLQEFIEYFTRRGILKTQKSIREGLYNGFAARQMIAHHHSAQSTFPMPNGVRNTFLQNLAAVGEYPTLSRNVAIINGAGNGARNPSFNTDNRLLDIEIKRNGWRSLWGACNGNICKKIQWTARTAPSVGNNKVAEMWTASPGLNALLWVPFGLTNVYASAAWGNSSQDDAPGGSANAFFDEETSTNIKFWFKEFVYLLTGSSANLHLNVGSFTMMPSYSAADIRYPSKNLYNRIDYCAPTPFKHVYAPTHNQTHVAITNESSWWFENEIAGNLPTPTRPPAPFVSFTMPTAGCMGGQYFASAPMADYYVWEVTGDLTVNGQTGSVTIYNNQATIASTSGQGGTLRIRAKTGTCFTEDYVKIICCSPVPDANFRWINSSPLPGEPLIAEVDNMPNCYKYLWFVGNDLLEETFTPRLDTRIWPCVNDGRHVTVVGVNPGDNSGCSSTQPVNGGGYDPLCHPMYYRTATSVEVSVYPNPATSVVEVSLQTITKSDAKEKGSITAEKQKQQFVTQVIVRNKLGAIQRIHKFNGNQNKVQFDVGYLSKDLYFLEVFSGMEVYKTTLSVR